MKCVGGCVLVQCDPSIRLMILEHDKDNDNIMSRRYVVDDLRQDDALLEDDNRHLVVCRETLPELQAWLAMELDEQIIRPREADPKEL